MRAAAHLLERLLPIRIFSGQYQVYFDPVGVRVDRAHSGHRDGRLPNVGALSHLEHLQSPAWPR
jgi:hypothetical protein